MNVIYVSCTCSKEKFSKLFNNAKIKQGEQLHKYHRLIMEGLVANGANVKTITAPPISRKNFNKILIKKDSDIEENILYTYLPMINIPILKNILVVLNSFRVMIKVLKEDANAVVICDVLNISISTGALIACKILKRKSIGIVTDIPMFQFKRFRHFIIKFNNFIINNFDSYVFLTEQMSEVINKKKAPYIVIEGQVDVKMKLIENSLQSKYDKKVCMYAGALHEKYGIKLLTEAFLKANIENSELHFYGTGDYQDDLIEICKFHKNIKYFGQIPIDIIVREELKATLLINPRLSNGEYTKYSFPSKNMEYMVSGTPVLTTKLPGMPSEYFNYIYLIEDETVEGISLKLMELLGKPREELHQKGLSARKFVLKYKNNHEQTKKILKL